MRRPVSVLAILAVIVGGLGRAGGCATGGSAAAGVGQHHA